MPDWVEPVARYMFEEGLPQHLLHRRHRRRREHADRRHARNAAHDSPGLAALIRGYVEIWRGLPIIVTLFIVFFVFPIAGDRFEFDPFTAGMIALTLWGVRRSPRRLGVQFSRSRVSSTRQPRRLASAGSVDTCS